MEESCPLPARPTLPAVANGHARRTAGAVRRGAPWREWLATLFTTAAIFLFTETFVLQGYKVCGSCMEPNLFTGERLLGNKTAYGLGHITRGEIVVFRPPHRPETPFIKRVIGLPGDLLEIRGGRVFLNGGALVEPYLHLAWYDDRPPVRVLPGMVFVMGDNRDNSSDSRAWGELPISNIQARAWLRYWPLSRFEVLR